MIVEFIVFAHNSHQITITTVFVPLQQLIIRVIIKGATVSRLCAENSQKCAKMTLTSNTEPSALLCDVSAHKNQTFKGVGLNTV